MNVSILQKCYLNEKEKKEKKCPSTHYKSCVQTDIKQPIYNIKCNSKFPIFNWDCIKATRYLLMGHEQMVETSLYKSLVKLIQNVLRFKKV